MDPLTAPWAMLGGAALSGLSQLGGGFISSGGQQSSNAQNIMAQQNQNFQNQMFQQEQNNQNQTFQNNVNVENWAFQREANAQNIALQRENRGWAQQQAENQMQFQQNMSNTQYQRAMADMRAAGLNPLLAYQQGGAGNLSGAMASQAAPTVGASQGNAAPPGKAFQGTAFTGSQNTAADLGRGISSMVTSAFDAYKTIAGVDAIQQSILKSKAETAKVEEETKTEPVRRVQIGMDTLRTSHDIENVKATLTYIGAQTASTLAAAGLTHEQIRVMQKWDGSTAPSAIQRIFWELGIGNSGQPDKSPAKVGGKPLELPKKSSGFVDWVRDITGGIFEPRK
ncbi:DNA pilot protein [robinz microvirus RP_34]|nr:DNA pilot protein [robinz microvirus RP_34]